MHESKLYPNQISVDQPVQSFGIRKASKFVEQLTDSNEKLRNNRLATLPNIFLNSQTLSSCINEGVIEVLLNLLLDEESKNISIVSNSLSVAFRLELAISKALENDCVPILMNAYERNESGANEHLLSCLYNITRFKQGVLACVEKSHVIEKVLNGMKNNSETKIISYKILYNMISTDKEALKQALETGIIKDLLEEITEESNTIEVKTLIAKILGFMCFHATARSTVAENSGLSKIVSLLKTCKDENFTASLLLSIVAMTTDDDGKLKFHAYPSDGEAIAFVIPQLYKTNRSIVLNTLKVLSNVAVYPITRSYILADSEAMIFLNNLHKSSDTLISKHADIALRVIQWKA
jgi:hypothetical protein